MDRQLKINTMKGFCMGFSKKKTKEILHSILKNAIEFTMTESDEALAPGASVIGGKPNMPEGFRWPFFEGSDYDGNVANHPLSFLAQFNLEEIAEYDTENRLPHTGFLSFFYDLRSMCWGFDPKDIGCAKVYYHDVPPDKLIPVEYPQELEPEYQVPQMTLSFHTVPNVPGFEEFDELYPNNDLDFDDYDEIIEDEFEVDTERDAEETFKLLGYADLIQNSMLSECEMVTSGIYTGHQVDLTDEQSASIAQKSRDWVLLCQFGTISDELMFGDCGCIYFYIRKQDLADKNFDNSHLILQCY